MPALDVAPLTPDERAKRRLERDRAVREADLPESTKLLLQTVAQHGDDELAANMAGHERTASAVDRQTKVFAALGGLGFALVVFLVAGFMYLAGVDLDAASRATREVTHTVTEKQ